MTTLKTFCRSTGSIYIFLFLLSTLFLNPYSPAQAQSSKQIKKVVLDAGHGGKDPGARGSYANEKDIALAVVLKLGQLLKDSLPDVQVIYTRKTDVFVELKERGLIANRAGADLFLSVHINATAGRKERVRTGYHYVGKGKKRRKVPTYKTVVHRETSAAGTETYVLGLSRNSEKEKSIGQFGETVAEEPGLLDENDPTTAMVIAQYSQAFLAKSINFASKIQRNYTSMGRNDLGVKQMSLQVLANSVMPGVLTELGFINNPSEEAYMNSEKGQMAYAMALFQAIKSYKKDIEK